MKICFYTNKIKDVLFKPETCAYPLYIQVESTTFCNLRCKMCVRNDKITNPRHLKLEEFKIIYDQIKAPKVTLSGLGEPLLNPQLPDMIKHAKSNEASVMIPSNGTLLNKNGVAKDLINSGLNVLKISIDAASSEVYEAVRGQDCFNDIIEGIKQLENVKKALKSSLPEIRLDFVILKDNIMEIPKVVELAKSLNIKTVFFRALQSEGLEGERKEDLGKDINFEQMVLFVKQGLDLGDKLGIKTNLGDIFRDFKHYKSIYVNRNANLNNQVCLLPFLQCYISLEGEVSPCCALFNNENVSVGNIFKEDFELIWNGDKMKNLRNLFKNNKSNFAVCRDCIPRSIPVLLKMSSMLPGFVYNSKK